MVQEPAKNEEFFLTYSWDFILIFITCSVVPEYYWLGIWPTKYYSVVYLKEEKYLDGHNSK